MPKLRGSVPLSPFGLAITGFLDRIRSLAGSLGKAVYLIAVLPSYRFAKALHRSVKYRWYRYSYVDTKTCFLPKVGVKSPTSVDILMI